MATLTDHPMFSAIVTTLTSIELRRRGVSRRDIQSVIDTLTPDAIGMVADANNIVIPDLPTTPTKEGAGGAILQQIFAAIKAFFGSGGAGQGLIQALVTFIIGLLGGGIIPIPSPTPTP